MRAVSTASMVAGCPAWMSDVPAESMVKARSSPARRTMVRNTPLAMGERQILAVQTKMTPMGMVRDPSTAIEWARSRFAGEFHAGRGIEHEQRGARRSLHCPGRPWTELLRARPAVPGLDVAVHGASAAQTHDAALRAPGRVGRQPAR